MVSRPLGGENFSHPLGKVFESLQAVRTVLLSDSPAIVSDVVQCFHDGRPIVITFPERHVEALPEPLGIALFAAEFLDVKLLNAVAENCDPVLGPAKVEDIANVEMPADRRTFELIHVARRFERAEQK